MKTLNESIQEIVNREVSNTTKRGELLKLGLTANDINNILRIYKGDGFSFADMTFGVEIECINCPRTTLIDNATRRGLTIQSEGYNHNNVHYYKIVSDGSLTGSDANEVVTPVLKGKNGLGDLKRLCKALSETGADVNKSCGLHVHIGLAGISDEHYVRIFKNYQAIEGAIDSFMPQSRRADEGRYCHTLKNYDFSGCVTKADVFSLLGENRYHKVNPCSCYRHGTIEFRQHSGTTDYEKIMRWVRFVAALVRYSAKNEIKGVILNVEDIPFIDEETMNFYINRRNALN